jgi:hypothetical protein
MKKVFEYNRVNHTTGNTEFVYMVFDDASEDVTKACYANKLFVKGKGENAVREIFSLFLTGRDQVLGPDWQV